MLMARYECAWSASETRMLGHHQFFQFSFQVQYCNQISGIILIIRFECFLSSIENEIEKRMQCIRHCLI